MGKFINPFTDVGFKRIFGQEINKDLLIDFLNALLEGERSVKDIRFLDKELLPEFSKDRGLIYDIYCTDEKGGEFIVEMQNKEHVNFRERTLYYLSQAIARQGERGADWKFGLKAVYGGASSTSILRTCRASSVQTSCWRTGIPTSCSRTRCVISFLNCLRSRKKKVSVRQILNVGFMC